MPAKKPKIEVVDQAPEKTPAIERLEKYLQDSSKNFFLSTLKDLGIPYQCLDFHCQRDKRPSTGQYMVPDKEGNIRFYTPDIYGEMECYTTDGANIKVLDWYMTRYEIPRKTKDGEAKYMPVSGGGTRLLITQPVVEAVKGKKIIEVLYLIEGFKKAHALSFHGNLPVIGMNGLTGFKEPQKERIRGELRDVLTTCSVKRVVIIDDSDLFDLGSPKDDNDYTETKRPNLFFRAAITAKTLIAPFCDVTLAHPKPGEKKLGFDDLLLSKRAERFTTDDLFLTTRKTDKGHEKVFADLKKTISGGDGEMFSSISLSAATDHKIKEYFHLGDVNQFYNYHIETLKLRPDFRFYTHTYKVREDGTPEEVKEEENLGYTLKKDGCLWKKGTGANAKDSKVANFTFEILFHIKGDETRRVLKLTNYIKQTAIIEVSGDDLNSPQRFNSICMDSGKFVFHGGKEDLLSISDLAMKHEKSAIIFSNIGYQPTQNVWAFANGIGTPDGWKPCDEFGIVEHNDEYYYFPAFSKFNDHRTETFADLRKYVNIPTEKTYTFEQWKGQFVKVYGENGEITACYYLATLFSDIVFNHRSGIRFPLLFASGKPKTGKSTIFISLLKLFGEGLIGESLTSNSTFKFLFTQMAKVRNGLVFFDEFDPQIVKIFDFLKNIFDRRPYGTKQYTNDTKTRVVPILSAVCVSGEVLPTGNHACFTRTISMMFNRTIDQRTDSEKEEMNILSRMEESGLTGITVALSKHRNLIEKHFDSKLYDVEFEVNKHFRGLNIDGRMIKSAVGILTVVKILIDENVIDYQTPWAELLKIWVRILTAQNQQIQTNTDAAKFWEIVEMLIREGKISEEAGDYKFENEYLVLRISRIQPPYYKRALELHFGKILEKSSLINYLENEPYYVPMLFPSGETKTTRFANSNPVEGIWCDYEMLQKMYKCDLTSVRAKEWEPKTPTHAPSTATTPPKTPDGTQDDLPF